MTYLIVNADDFGASLGINRAIVELHDVGVVTSTSLMVNMPAADDAVRRALAAPNLGIGLHVTLTHEDGVPLLDFDDEAACATAIRSQIDAFARKLGRLPSHLDSHQNVHRDASLRPLFVKAAREYGLPLREHSAVRYFSSFYGQWDGVPHPEHIAIENLLAMLERELDGGLVELSCHPGYVGDDFASSYNAEREIERRTLSDARLLDFFKRRDVTLIRFCDPPVRSAIQRTT